LCDSSSWKQINHLSTGELLSNVSIFKVDYLKSIMILYTADTADKCHFSTIGIFCHHSSIWVCFLVNKIILRCCVDFRRFHLVLFVPLQNLLQDFVNFVILESLNYELIGFFKYNFTFLSHSWSKVLYFYICIIRKLLIWRLTNLICLLNPIDPSISLHRFLSDFFIEKLI
jgi:hypothetical protein